MTETAALLSVLRERRRYHDIRISSPTRHTRATRAPGVLVSSACVVPKPEAAGRRLQAGVDFSEVTEVPMSSLITTPIECWSGFAAPRPRKKVLRTRVAVRQRDVATVC